MVNNKPFPGTFDLEKVKDAKDVTTMDKNVETTEINALLKTYLETGICKLPSNEGSTL